METGKRIESCSRYAVNENYSNAESLLPYLSSTGEKKNRFWNGMSEKNKIPEAREKEYLSVEIWMQSTVGSVKNSC